MGVTLGGGPTWGDWSSSPQFCAFVAASNTGAGWTVFTWRGHELGWRSVEATTLDDAARMVGEAARETLRVETT